VVEQPIRNRQVASSTLALGSIFASNCIRDLPLTYRQGTTKPQPLARHIPRH
jgi:hypothetical protein